MNNYSDYVNNEWVAYGARSNQRQIPSMCDGQTITTRKLLWALRSTKQYEIVERLGLRAAEATSYAHGGANMVNSLVGMVKDFPGTNNVPFFDGEGQFGYPADHEASAARYISCRINGNFTRWFNRKDFDILERVEVRGELLEPKVLAPIAPVVLVNGGFGIGSGYQCNIPQFLPADVIRATLEVLEHHTVLTPLTPNWVGYHGTIQPDPHKFTKFHPVGVFQRIDTSTLVITSLPPSYTEKSYTQKVLVPLYEAQAIQKFDNESNELDGWRIVVKFKRGVLGKMADAEVTELLGLVNKRSPININACLWGVDGKLKTYEYIETLLEDWVTWRVDLYEKRRTYELQKIDEELTYENGKMWLVEQYTNNAKLQTEEYLVNGLSQQGLNDHQINRLLNTPIRTITKQGAMDSSAKQQALHDDYRRLSSITARDYMLQEVKHLLTFYEV